MMGRIYQSRQLCRNVNAKFSFGSISCVKQGVNSLLGHQKISTSLLTIGLNFYFLLVILVLKLEKKITFAPITILYPTILLAIEFS
jgi:hypothetical protein